MLPVNPGHLLLLVELQRRVCCERVLDVLKSIRRVAWRMLLRSRWVRMLPLTAARAASSGIMKVAVMAHVTRCGGDRPCTIGRIYALSVNTTTFTSLYRISVGTRRIATTVAIAASVVATFISCRCRICWRRRGIKMIPNRRNWMSSVNRQNMGIPWKRHIRV
jgi:hypothetical protein